MPFSPAQMLTVLPLGFLFYMHGSLSAETFITVIILALGMAAPIVAAFNFVDTLAQVGTTVSQVDEILKAEEQQHGTERVTFENHDIEMKDVSFGYHDDKARIGLFALIIRFDDLDTVYVFDYSAAHLACRP